MSDGMPLVMDDATRARMIADRLIVHENVSTPEIEHDIATGGLSTKSLHAFATAARSLKAAEDALIAARQAYAEAVKALSEEAVR